jgi:hypothetical protein
LHAAPGGPTDFSNGLKNVGKLLPGAAAITSP